MKPKLRMLKKQLEQAGGRVMIPQDLPDDVAELFAKVIADCPDCAAAMAATSKRDTARREH